GLRSAIADDDLRVVHGGRAAALGRRADHQAGAGAVSLSGLRPVGPPPPAVPARCGSKVARGSRVDAAPPAAIAKRMPSAAAVPKRPAATRTALPPRGSSDRARLATPAAADARHSIADGPTCKGRTTAAPR